MRKTEYLIPHGNHYKNLSVLQNVVLFRSFSLNALLNSRILPESVRWLVTTGKIKEAKHILLKVAKTNGVLSEELRTKFEMTSLLDKSSVSR